MSCHSPTHLSCLLGQVFCPCNCLPTVLLRCKEVRPPHQASGAPGLSRKPATGLKETFTCRQQKELEGDNDHLGYGCWQVTKALRTNNAFTYTLKPTLLR